MYQFMNVNEHYGDAIIELLLEMGLGNVVAYNDSY